ncbi:MAG: hypothetical protein FWC80_00540 [Firmicutes bacterium]|nr:hypothetical protein [Bacillota bacterium]
MDKNIAFHCLFEQSGTFKNMFKSYGHNAYNYDILNDYGQTDFAVDLFKEIENQFDNITKGTKYKTIFSNMQPKKDFIFAFFPCTYFADTNELLFKGYYGQHEPNLDKTTIERILKRIKNRAYNFALWTKFCFVCQELNIPTIIENPAIGNSYLKLYSAWQPSITDIDRSRFGDKFKKPTYFFAINFEVKENFMWFDKEYSLKIVRKTRGKERSEITSRYADNFYKRFFLKTNHTKPKDLSLFDYAENLNNF